MHLKKASKIRVILIVDILPLGLKKLAHTELHQYEIMIIYNSDKAMIKTENIKQNTE